MKDQSHLNPSIAVLLPCFNEEQTIADVVARFRQALPTAAVYVYDNNSTDQTALKARQSGALVVREPRQGKGNVVRRMFADIEADIYVIADGDGTYLPEDAPQLVNTLLTEQADMVIGTRRGVTDDAGRRGHAIGNRAFNWLYTSLFGDDFTDIFSGYRAFTRRFIKSFPAISNGFEIETEMSVHASALKLPVCEIPLEYGRRPEGSSSKLSTFQDGAKILWMIAMLMKETKPFRFFGVISLAVLAVSLTLMVPVLVEYFQVGLVPRLPTWVLSIGLLVMSMLFAMTGLVLDSVARSRIEQKRILYLAVGATRPEGQSRRSQPEPAMHQAGADGTRAA